MKIAIFFALVTGSYACYSSNSRDQIEETDKIRPQLTPAIRPPVLVNPRPRAPQKKKSSKSKPDYDPKEVERQRVFSPEPSSRCEAPGAEGKPCSYTMNIGQDCEEKQWWSDNGWTIYRSKCVRSPKDPRFSIRETLIQTCSYGKCHAGGGSG